MRSPQTSEYHFMAGNSTGVFKRGKQYWIRYSVDRIQYREPAKTTRKAEAEALLAKRKTEIFEGRFFPEKRQADLTIGGLRKLWLDNAKGKKSYTDDVQRFKRIVEHFGAAKRVAALLPKDLVAFQNALKDTTTNRGTPMKPATVNRHVSLLQWALNLATTNHYHHRVPPGSVKPLPENNERDRICSPEEYERLIEAAHPQLRLAIIIGYHSAMRLGEIAALTWDQIDLNTKLVRVRAADTKTNKGRPVPFSSEVVEALKAWPRRLDGKVFNAGSDCLSSDFSELRTELSIDDLHFHDLRHTALTNFRRAGMDLVTIKKISGHKTWKMVERYQTVDDGDIQKAMAQVEEARSRQAQ